MNDEIYQIPLTQFAAVRDQLASRLKASGDKAGAAELKRARKPTVPAWAANQVVWKAPEAWKGLQAATGALRKSHEESTSPEDLRQATREQREALRVCETRAADLLAREGHTASPAVLERVGNTLLALALGVAGATPGRLEHELQPPGFEVLAGLSLATPEPRVEAAAPTSSAAPAPEVAAVAARQDVEGKACDEERARQAAALAAAEAQRESTLRAVTEARARLAADEERLHALESEMTAARRSCEESRRRLEIAESEHAASEAAHEALG